MDKFQLGSSPNAQMDVGRDSVTSLLQYRKPNIEEVFNMADSVATSCVASDIPTDTRIEITLSDSGLDVVILMHSGREILDRLENDCVVRAQIAAAMRRLYRENLSRVTAKEAKELTSSGAIDLRHKVKGIPDADLNLEVILKALEVPNAPEMQEFTADQVMELMADVLQTDNRFGVINDSLEGNAALYCKEGGKDAGILSVSMCDKLSTEFPGVDLSEMTVSAFGNFLYAVKHHGDEVALAVLSHIYSSRKQD